MCNVGNFVITSTLVHKTVAPPRFELCKLRHRISVRFRRIKILDKQKHDKLLQ